MTIDTSAFHGTENWYRFSPLTRHVITEGVKYVAEKSDNFGLMQDICIDLDLPRIWSHLEDGIVGIEIDTEGFGLKFSDGNGKVLWEYELSGYPKLKIKLFAGLLDEKTATLLLPTEY